MVARLRLADFTNENWIYPFSLRLTFFPQGPESGRFYISLFYFVVDSRSR